MGSIKSASHGNSRRSGANGKVAKQSGKELVILTGISGAGKASALKTFEDLGYQAVDNLPLELLPEFAGLVAKSAEIERAAIVVDVREGLTLDRLPEEYRLLLLLVADHELSYEEIGELTGQSGDAVRGKLHRARKVFASHFQQTE